MASFVTFFVPCYKSERYLLECLASIQQQTVTNWEAIVVDDKSPGYEELNIIVGSLDDERFSIIRHIENRGLAAARNTAIRAARTSWIVPVDADDRLAPNYLERCLEYLNMFPDIDILMPSLQEFGCSHNVRPAKIRPTKELTRWQWIAGPGIFMRRLVWEQVGGYCEAQELRAGNEDWDFWLQAFRANLKIIPIHDILYHYRVHAANMSVSLRLRDFETREFILKHHGDLIKKFKEELFFTAAGYLISANAHKEGGDPKYAKILLFRGGMLLLRALPRIRLVCTRLLIRCILPVRFLSVNRRMRSWLSA